MRISLRPPLPAETDWESLSLFTLIPAGILGRLWLALSLPLPPCGFKKFTGCPCPGCGATRAAHELFRGNMEGALMLNPMATAGAVMLAAWCAYAFAVRLTAGKRRLRLDGAPSGLRPTLFAFMIVATIVNWWWVIRHLPESPWHHS